MKKINETEQEKTFDIDEVALSVKITTTKFFLENIAKLIDTEKSFGVKNEKITNLC